MLTKPGRHKPFDPRKRKAKDNARQRKIVANSSDKAFRKGAPQIKAMANRRVRRTDKAALSADHEASAQELTEAHKRKDRHWGTENAAKRRETQRQTRAEMQEAGGRLELQLKRLEDLPKRAGPMKDWMAENLRRAIARKKGLIAVLVALPLMGEAQTIPDYDLFCNRTIHFFDFWHGNQIEFFAPDGRTHLWYPGEPEAIPGEWEVRRTNGAFEMCFRYPPETINPLTGQPGGVWRCSDYDGFLSTIVDLGVVDGDPFALSTGAVPFELFNFPEADLSLLISQLPPDVQVPEYSTTCADLLS